MRVALDRCWRVRLWVQIRLPMPAERVWAQAQDFARFTTRDPFHRRMCVEGPPRQGSSLVIEHVWLGWRTTRVGRILRWAEGRGYAFSDLAQHRPQAAFPHVYEYRIVPTGEASSIVVLRVRGRWTARFLPRWVVKAWLAWVMWMAALRLENHLLAGERAQRGPAALRL